MGLVVLYFGTILLHWRANLETVKNQNEVFRRFDRFGEALAWALANREGHELLRIIHSPARELNAGSYRVQHSRPDESDAAQPSGPWIVESECGMVRYWELVVARFERGRRAHIDRHEAARIEDRYSREWCRQCKRVHAGFYCTGDPILARP